MSRIRLLVIIPFLVGTGLIILACSSTASPQNSGVVVTGTVAAPTPLPHFKVGQQVQVGDIWVITLNSAKSSPGDNLFQPASGNAYIVLDVTLKNISNQSQDVSSAISFTFKDATGEAYTESFTDIGKPPDGTVTAGDQLRGQLVYEVPSSQNTFTLAFQADVLSGGATIWDISV